MGWRMRSLLIGSAALAMALTAMAIPWVRDYRAVERDAAAARASIALGRVDPAREPLQRWLRAGRDRPRRMRWSARWHWPTAALPRSPAA